MFSPFHFTVRIFPLSCALADVSSLIGFTSITLTSYAFPSANSIRTLSAARVFGIAIYAAFPVILIFAFLRASVFSASEALWSGAL